MAPLNKIDEDSVAEVKELAQVPLNTLVPPKKKIDDTSSEITIMAENVLASFREMLGEEKAPAAPLERATVQLIIKNVTVTGFKEVPADGLKPGYVVYDTHCGVLAGGKVLTTCTASHRFSEFLSLHQTLARDLALPDKFQVPKAAPWDMASGEAKTARGVALAEYVASVVAASGELPPTVLCDFLGIDVLNLAAEVEAQTQAAAEVPVPVASNAFMSCLRCL